MKKNQAYDLIGDIHGHHDKLTTLLRHLNYEPTSAGFRHPEGRRVVFLGDYIDRGPKIRETLLTVRAMCEAGDALAIMGNHEFNAVGYHTSDGNGGTLRAHDGSKTVQHQATLDTFEGHDAEWNDWLHWFKGLPMFLELDGLRAVHACWDPAGIPHLQGCSLHDRTFLLATATPGTPEHRAVENVLKGPELALGEGETLTDNAGTVRHAIRTRWWDLRPGLSLAEIAMPPGCLVETTLLEDYKVRSLPDYPPHALPVFFGHYWLRHGTHDTPLRGNLACLDFSAGLDGPLVAYRWDGEQTLNREKFVWA